MLGQKTGNRRTAEATLSVIAAGVTIKGDILTEGDLHIDGRVEGDIICGSIVQGASGAITGKLTASTARLAGAIDGTVEAATLTIENGARITGDVTYMTVTIETGAKVDGRMSHRGDGADTTLRLIDATA